MVRDLLSICRLQMSEMCGIFVLLTIVEVFMFVEARRL